MSTWPHRRPATVTNEEYQARTLHEMEKVRPEHDTPAARVLRRAFEQAVGLSPPRCETRRKRR